MCACVWHLHLYSAYTQQASVHLLMSWYPASFPQTWAAARRTALAEPGSSLLHLWPLGPLGALHTVRWVVAESPAQPWLSTGSRIGCSSFLADLHWSVDRTEAPGFIEYIHVRNRQVLSVSFPCLICSSDYRCNNKHMLIQAGVQLIIVFISDDLVSYFLDEWKHSNLSLSIK